MAEKRNAQSEYSRREFIKRSALASAPLVGAGLMGGSSMAGEKEPCVPKEYKVVQNWPEAGCPRVKSRGIGADKTGRIFVAGDDKLPVYMLSPEGKYLGDFGQGILKTPHGLRIHKNTVWVHCLDNHQAYQFSLDGKLLRTFGRKGKPGDGPDQFNRPTDFAFGPDGAIYISDGYANTRVICRKQDGSIRKIWGEKGTGPSQFNLVHAIAIDKKNRVYVGDRNNNRIQIFDLKGKFVDQWTHVGKPYGFYSCDNGALFVCGLEPDSGKFRVLKLGEDGKILDEFGSTGEGPGQFKMAHSIYVDKAGAVYVADGSINRVQKFTLCSM